jgi:hypothetical protein
MSALVTVRCVFCQHTMEVGPQRDVPMCPKCWSPMVAQKARAVLDRLGGVEKETPE